MKSFRVFFFIVLTLGAECAAQSEWTMCSRDRECSSWAKDESRFAPPFITSVLQLPVPYLERKGVYVDFLTYSRGLLHAGVSDAGLPNSICTIDPATGESPWSGAIQLTGGAIGMSPVIAGDVVVAGGQGQSARLVGFDRLTGSANWTRLFGQMYARQAVVDGGLIYTRQDTLRCIDPATGLNVWWKPIGSSIGGSGGWPAVDDARIYYTARDTLFAVTKTSGDAVWHSPGGQREGLCIDADRVYVSTRTGIRAVDKTDGSTVWTHTIPDGKTVAYIDGNGMAVDDRRLAYVVWEDKDSVGTLTVLDKATGDQLWTHVFSGTGMCAPTIANGIVYVVNWSTFTLWGFDMQSGAERFFDDREIYRTQPIIADETMFVGIMNPDSLGAGIATFVPSWIAAEPVSASPDLRADVYPNPFSGATIVRISLPHSTQMRVEVTDALGRPVHLLAEGPRSAGVHAFTLSFSRLATLASGMYCLRLVTPERCITRTLIYQR